MSPIRSDGPSAFPYPGAFAEITVGRFPLGHLQALLAPALGPTACRARRSPPSTPRREATRCSRSSSREQPSVRTRTRKRRYRCRRRCKSWSANGSERFPNTRRPLLEIVSAIERPTPGLAREGAWAGRRRDSRARRRVCRSDGRRLGRRGALHASVAGRDGVLRDAVRTPARRPPTSGRSCRRPRAGGSAPRA